MLFMLVLSSCSNNDEPSPANEGSPRVWAFGKEQVEFYINGVEQTSVTEITVRSLQLEGCGDNDALPLSVLYNNTDTEGLLGGMIDLGISEPIIYFKTLCKCLADNVCTYT